MRRQSLIAETMIVAIDSGAPFGPSFWDVAIAMEASADDEQPERHDVARTVRADAAETERLVNDFFALGGVGYVAVGRGQDVVMRKHPRTLPRESNFYEELLVNPTLLTLASQRGELDCGGLGYIAVGYGGFIEMLMRMKGGHVSLGVSPKTQVGEFAQAMAIVLKRHGLALGPA